MQVKKILNFLWNKKLNSNLYCFYVCRLWCKWKNLCTFSKNSGSKLVEAYCPNQYTVTWECTKVDVKLWGHFWSPSCLVVFASLGCKNKSATIKGVAFAIKNCFLINHLILAKLNVKVTQATKLYFCLEVFCWVKKINCHFKYILLEHR